MNKGRKALRKGKGEFAKHLRREGKKAFWKGLRVYDRGKRKEYRKYRCSSRAEFDSRLASAGGNKTIRARPATKAVYH